MDVQCDQVGGFRHLEEKISKSYKNLDTFFFIKPSIVQKKINYWA
jgi:hypothetical protein